MTEPIDPREMHAVIEQLVAARQELADAEQRGETLSAMAGIYDTLLRGAKADAAEKHRDDPISYPRTIQEAKAWAIGIATATTATKLYGDALAQITADLEAVQAQIPTLAGAVTRLQRRQGELDYLNSRYLQEKQSIEGG